MSFNVKNYNNIINFISKNSLNSTELVAVSKNHNKEVIEKAINHGIYVFGENRVKEARDKFLNIKNNNHRIKLHLTGPLQTNKVKQALDIFDVIQTLDREKLAKELVKFQDVIKLKQFFIQINTGKENNKSGIFPENASEFINFCKRDLNIPVLGLMCIPPIDDLPKIHFNLLKKIAHENRIEKLSMGMSSDYEEAIICGATHIRVGTKIFGIRD